MNPDLLFLISNLGLAFFFSYLFFKAREEHNRKAKENGEKNPVFVLFQGLIIAAIFLNVYMVGVVNLDSEDYCDIVKVNQTDVDGMNQTDKTFEYDRLCFEKPGETHTRFYEMIIWLMRGLVVYIIASALWSMKGLFLGLIDKLKGK